MYYVLYNTASSRATRRASAVPNARATNPYLGGRLRHDSLSSGVTKFGLLHHELK